MRPPGFRSLSRKINAGRVKAELSRKAISIPDEPGTAEHV